MSQQPITNNIYEVAIIGAGPGGLGAAGRAARCGISHVLFEKGEIGNTIFNYQLRKHVMAEPAKLMLRSEIDFAAGKREEILASWNSRVVELGINVCQAEVISVLRSGEEFVISYKVSASSKSDGTAIHPADQQIIARHVIMAIGMQGTPRKLGVPGSELSHISYTLSDPDAFKDQKILVVGAGDAAIENALALAQQNEVMILNRAGEFSRAKDANAAAITDYINSGKIRCFFDSELQEVLTDKVVVNTPQGEVTAACNHVLARLGCIMPRKFLEECGIAFTNDSAEAIPKIDSNYQSTVKGLYVIGALVGYPLIKQAINQGYEVIEHIRGVEIEPADQPLIRERLAALNLGENLDIEKALYWLRESMPLFKELSEPQFRELIIESSLQCRPENDVIFKKNDHGDSFFSVISGAVRIDISDNKSKEIVSGHFFGEMGLISGRRRSATVRVASTEGGAFVSPESLTTYAQNTTEPILNPKALQMCILLETPRKQILKLIASVEHVKNRIDSEFLIRALQTSIFPEADQQSLERIIPLTSFRRFKRGEVLFREGDLGEALYVIRKGSVKVSRLDRSGRDITQTYIAAGNFVGEMALLSDGNALRSATVTAVVPCETVVLRKEDFRVMLRDNPKEMERIHKIAQVRKVENIVVNQNHSQGSLLDFMFTQGVTDADNFLMIDSDLCISCDNCETACAATHGGYSRLDRKGGKSFASIQVPVSCRHCENPLCMVDCPPDALARQPNGEVVIRESCIGCGNCIRNCPYGVIQLVYEDQPGRGSLPKGGGAWNDLLNFFGFKLLRKKTKKSVGVAKAGKCDMCYSLSGGPACVRSCPTGAAIRVNPSQLLKMLS